MTNLQEDSYRLTLRLNEKTGEFDKSAMHEGFRNNDWLRSRLTIADIFEVATRIEYITSKFLRARICRWIFYILAGCSIFAIGFGIAAITEFIRHDDDKKQKDKWDRLMESLPFIIGIIVIPILCIAVYFIKRLVLSRYEQKVSTYFAEINEFEFKSRNLYWRVGNMCSDIQLAIISTGYDPQQSFFGRGGIDKEFVSLIPNQANLAKPVPQNPHYTELQEERDSLREPLQLSNASSD